MSAAPDEAHDRQGRTAPAVAAGEARWALQVQAVEQRMARRRQEIRRAWGAMEQQTAPWRWLRSAVVPGLLGLAGGAALAMLWQRRRTRPRAGRPGRRDPAGEAHHHHAGLGAVLLAAAWPLARRAVLQVVQPAMERVTEAQLAALAERWLRPRAPRNAGRHASSEGAGAGSSASATAPDARPDARPGAPGKT